MPATKTRRETIYDKAERILADPSRVRTLSAHADDWWIGDVLGDHGRTYLAMSFSEDYKRLAGIRLGGRVGCTCKAGAMGRLCKHSLVAEEMRLRGELE